MAGFTQSLADYAPSYRVLLVSAGVLALLVLAYRSLFTIRYPKNLLRLGEQEGVSWAEMRKRFHEDSLSVFNEVYENVGHFVSGC
jgi:hypothetical protein